MFSPERKVAKMTCPSCEHRFSSKGNLSRHFVYFPEHRLVVEPFLSCKEAVANFLDGDLSSYHRKARLRELFTKLSNEELAELALPRLAKLLSLSGFLYEKCRKKSGEIKRESVKEEFCSLLENVCRTFPSIPRELPVKISPSVTKLFHSGSPMNLLPQLSTPDRRLAQFVDDRSDNRMSLETLIIQNKTLACETLLNCCDGVVARDIFMPMFVEKYHEAFLEFGQGVVSTFGISQNQLNSFLRGHWGKKLEQKTGLNPILPRYCVNI